MTTQPPFQNTSTASTSSSTPKLNASTNNDSTHFVSYNKITHENLKDIVLKLNTYIQAFDTKIAFHFNDSIDALEVNVLEMQSGQLIRKIPTDEVVRLAEYYQRIYGIIFDKKI